MNSVVTLFMGCFGYLKLRLKIAEKQKITKGNQNGKAKKQSQIKNEGKKNMHQSEETVKNHCYISDNDCSCRRIIRDKSVRIL